MVNLTRWDPFGDVTRFGLFRAYPVNSQTY